MAVVILVKIHLVYMLLLCLEIYEYLITTLLTFRSMLFPSMNFKILIYMNWIGKGKKNILKPS